MFWRIGAYRPLNSQKVNWATAQEPPALWQCPYLLTPVWHDNSGKLCGIVGFEMLLRFPSRVRRGTRWPLHSALALMWQTMPRRTGPCGRAGRFHSKRHVRALIGCWPRWRSVNRVRRALCLLRLPFSYRFSLLHNCSSWQHAISRPRLLRPSWHSALRHDSFFALSPAPPPPPGPQRDDRNDLPCQGECQQEHRSW